MMNINVNEFKANKTEAMENIANQLRAAQSYEDGQYYFHFTVDDEKVTVTAAINVEDMCDAAGMEHDADMGDILVNFEETERFNDVVEEIYDAVLEEI